jgi:hypothetical protein
MSWMKHFADFSADLYFFNLSVLKQKFNIESSESDFSADFSADLSPVLPTQGRYFFHQRTRKQKEG